MGPRTHDTSSQWAQLAKGRVVGDGRFLFVREGIAPGRTARIELATGRHVPWKVLFPGDPAGVAHIRAIRFTPDGEGYAYGYGRYLQARY